MSTLRKFFMSGLLIGTLSLSARAKGPNADTIPDPDSEFERQSFKIADGWQISLFAADPMVEKPIQMNWDGKGRLWCATSETYPQLAPGKTPNDKIYILQDTTGSGKADKSTIFAEGLFLPTAVVPGDGGAYVTNSTEILHLKDTTGSGKADQRRIVLSGFGTEDTHHIVHTLRWGPDGKLYFIQSIYIHSHLETPHGLKTLLASGVWRFDTRTLDLDVYSRGLINPWGILWNYWGQTFETDGAGGEGINYAFPGVCFTSAAGAEKVMKGLNPGSPKYASEEVLSGANVPDDYQGDILTNDFRADRIVRFKLSDNGAGFTSKQMPDFLTSTDRAFRPVDIKMGPDGAIYIADWYNPIINHGEVDFRDPRRDHVHGRIWRVTAINRPLVEKPTIAGATVEQLLEYLKAPEDWTRAQAKLALREKDPKDVMPLLTAWVRKLKPSDPKSDHHRLEALWTCENLNVVDSELLARVLKSDDSNARAAGTRVVGHWAAQLENPMALLRPMVQDDAPRVRLEAIRALAEVKKPEAITMATQVLDKPMDPFLEYGLWLTCHDLEPVWMPAFQAGTLNGWEKPEHRDWALRAVGSPAAIKAVVDQIKSEKTSPELRRGLIQQIAALGTANGENLLFDLAIDNPMHDPGAQAAALTALQQTFDPHTPRPQHPERLNKLVDDSNPQVAAAAMRLAGVWRRGGLKPKMMKVIESPDSNDVVRAGALDGLALMHDADSIATLQKLSAPPTAAKTRRLAVAALAGVDLKAAAAQGADLIASGDPDPGTILAAFLNRAGGTDAIAEALSAKKLPSDSARLALRYLRTTTSQDPKLTQILSSAAGMSGQPVKLSPDQMKQTIEEVLAKGNAANGERVFRRLDTSCYQCHSIDGAGGWLAPDLSSIGASSPIDYLINAVLDPNKDIKDGYDGYNVVTKSGDVISGIKVSQDNTHLVLKDNTRQEIPILLSDIKLQKSIGSLMPNGLTDTLTHQEFLDLVRFLSELGKPGPYASSPTQYVRRWRTIDPVPSDLASTSEPSSTALASLDGKNWPPQYSLVSGVLPADAIVAKGKPVGYARGEVNVTAAGKIRLVLNDAKAVSVWVDNKPVNAASEITLDLPTGLHSLTFRVDANARGDEGLRIEVADVPGSTGHAQPVGGR